MAQKTTPKNCKRATVSLIRSTHSLRARAMSNQIKEKLLGEEHDPHSAQTETVLACPNAPVKEAITWESWRNGSVKMQSASRAACDQIVPNVSRWIEFPHLGSAIQRHLAALDVMLELNDERKAERVLACLESVRKTWQLFSSIDVLRDDQIAHCIRSLTGHVNGITPTRKHADERSAQLMKMGMVNPYYFNFPAKASEDFANSAEGMLWYLLGLTKYPHDIQPSLATGLVFDIATCIALVHAGNASTLAGRSKAFLIGLQFWDHALGMETRRSMGDFWTPLRRHYYAELRALGISFRDIHELVGPIKILGETNILKHVAPPSGSTKFIPLQSATNQVIFIRQGGVEVTAPDQQGAVMPSQVQQVASDVDMIASITSARREQASVDIRRR
jgi:hypothetical protein